MTSISNKRGKITRGRKRPVVYYNGIPVMSFTKEDLDRITRELAELVDKMLLLEMIKKENNAR